MSALQFKKATRQQVKLKLAISGTSGSGKTEGALTLARELVGPAGKIAVLDTENGSASLYADRHDFDVIDLAPPYRSELFTQAIRAAVAGGYDVLIIDSLSHQWEGSGGILDRKTEEERNAGAKANGFALWAKYKEEHRRFMAGMLQAPIHIIACMRSRTEHVQENGRVHKLGMAPITGENAEYEFSILFDLNMDHKANTSKDRSRLFDGRHVDLLRDGVGTQIAEWLAAGAPVVPAAPETIARIAEVIETLREYDAAVADRFSRAFTLRRAELEASEDKSQEVLAKVRDALGRLQHNEIGEVVAAAA